MSSVERQSWFGVVGDALDQRPEGGLQAVESGFNPLKIRDIQPEASRYLFPLLHRLRLA